MDEQGADSPRRWGMNIEKIKNEPLSLSVLIGLFLFMSAAFAYADDFKGWVGNQIDYRVALHVAGGSHLEARESSLRLERNHHKAEQSAIRRAIKDYNSRIYTRTNGGSIELNSRQRAEVKYYQDLISDLTKEEADHEKEIDRLTALIDIVRAEIDHRPIPIAP